MSAYEQATGKFFLDTVSTLYDVLREYVPQLKSAIGGQTPTEEALDNRRVASAVLRKVPITDLRALIWAAYHEYDRHDEPTWPLTQSQVGRLISPLMVPRLFLAFMTCQTANTPTPEEMGESQAPRPEKKAEASGAPQDNGGGSFTESLAVALG
jgi:hypothetical protein